MMRFVRWWLPGLVVAGGIILWAIDPSADRAEGAAAIVGAGLAIFLLNLLFRFGVSGDRARDEEDEARAFFDRHGYWPDEAPAERKSDPHAVPHKRAPHPRQ